MDKLCARFSATQVRYTAPNRQQDRACKTLPSHFGLLISSLLMVSGGARRRRHFVTVVTNHRGRLPLWSQWVTWGRLLRWGRPGKLNDARHACSTTYALQMHAEKHAIVHA